MLAAQEWSTSRRKQLASVIFKFDVIIIGRAYGRFYFLQKKKKTQVSVLVFFIITVCKVEIYSKVYGSVVFLLRLNSTFGQKIYLLVKAVLRARTRS